MTYETIQRTYTNDEAFRQDYQALDLGSAYAVDVIASLSDNESVEVRYTPLQAEERTGDDL